MNLENIIKSKSHLVFAIIGIIAVFIIFFFLINQFNFESKQSTEPLSQNDISSINTSVQKELSDTFKPDELVISEYRGDHNWAIAVVGTTTPEEVEGGFVLMQNTNQGWQVAYGPATDYYKEDLLKLGAPEQLIDQIDQLGSPIQN